MVKSLKIAFFRFGGNSNFEFSNSDFKFELPRVDLGESPKNPMTKTAF